jgi:hypothetical protein
LFIVLFVFSGLGFFCGPLLELTSSWINYVPGGMVTLVSLTIGAGVSLFSNLEGLPQSDAIYASFVVGKFFFVGLFDHCSLVLLKFSIGCFPNFITMSYERNDNRVSLRRQRCLTLQRIPMVIYICNPDFFIYV